MKQDEELDVFSTPFVDFHNTVDEAAFFFFSLSLLPIVGQLQKKLLAHALDVTA